MKYSGAAVQGLAILMGMDGSSAEQIRDQHNAGHDMTDWINHGLRKDRSTMGSKSNPGAYDCYSKAEPDEPMFVLLGRDPVASLVVEYWAALREQMGHTSEEKLNEAKSCAAEMQRWLTVIRTESLLEEAEFAERCLISHIESVGNAESSERIQRLEALCRRAAEVLAAQVEGGLVAPAQILKLVEELRSA